MSNYFDSHNFVFNNFYEILELNEDATVEQVRKNYLRLAKKYHPDQGGNSQMFELISQAYECLSKPDFRKNYDLEYNNMKNDGHKNNYDINYLKYEFDDYKKKNTKNLNENLYNTVFTNSVQKDMAFKQDDFINKITDIKAEREMNEIEFTDDYYKNIVDKNNVNINDLFEYMKTENDQQLINKPLDTYDMTLNNFSMTYSSFNQDSNTLPMNLYNLNSNTNFIEPKKNFDINKFSEWKQTKKTDTKITSDDIDNYIKQRKEIEQEITKQIDNNIKDYKKKSDIEKFMQLENKINIEDLFLTK